MDGCCEGGNEPSGAVKREHFVEGWTSADCHCFCFLNDVVNYNHLLIIIIIIIIIILQGVSFTLSLTTEFLLHRKAGSAVGLAKSFNSFQGWYLLELLLFLLQWRFNNISLHMSVFIWCWNLKQ